MAAREAMCLRQDREGFKEDDEPAPFLLVRAPSFLGGFLGYVWIADLGRLVDCRRCQYSCVDIRLPMVWLGKQCDDCMSHGERSVLDGPHDARLRPRRC